MAVFLNFAYWYWKGFAINASTPSSLKFNREILNIVFLVVRRHTVPST